MEKQNTIKDEAEAYEQPSTRNISELAFVLVTEPILTYNSPETAEKPFSYKYITRDGEKYRVPGVVIGQLKDILESNPLLQKFKVKKSGTGDAGNS